MFLKLFTNRAGTSSSGLPFHRREENGGDGASGEGSGAGVRGKSGTTVPTKQIKFESNTDGWHRSAYIYSCEYCVFC